MIEKHEFPSGRGYFRVHLVLEHHVLRRMNDGGRCVMSKMEPGKGIARAGDKGCSDSHSLVIFEKIIINVLSSWQERILAPEITTPDKIDCQKAELTI